MASSDTSQAQPTVAQQTQIQASTGQPTAAQQGQVPPGQPTQPIIYQMAPGQPQPVFVQVPPGQPSTTPEGQPIQYYYVPTAQPVQPGQPGKTGYPVQPVHPIQAGQPVQGYPAPGQPMYAAQPQQQPGSGISISIDYNFLKSPLCYVKIGEFVTLLGAWASLLRYLDAFSDSYYDGKADFFKGITIFCWVMVIMFIAMYTFSIYKLCGCNNRPSTWTLTIFITYFVLSSLLLACSGNLVPRAVFLTTYFDDLTDKAKPYAVALFVALAFGFLSWALFIADMCLTYKKFQEQRTQEAPPDQAPGQPRAWDIDYDFVKSAAFKIKLSEIVTLLVAWACILKYIDLYRLLGTTDSGPSVVDEKANFFKGITIFAWVMVILLLLTFVFSLGRLCQRRSYWTLTAIIINFVLSALLIACSGNLVPKAIDLGKDYEQVPDQYKPNVIALFIGLAFGFISWALFIADMCLTYKKFQEQKAQEAPPDQGPDQPRAWDIDYDFVKSAAFKIKLSEIVTLLVAWACILKYIELYRTLDTTDNGPSVEDTKANFFKGITIFAWVMVILLLLTFVFSLGRLCQRRSYWTLTAIIIYFVLSALLIACSGNLVPRAIDLGKDYEQFPDQYKPNVMALFIGLGFGIISWFLFIADMSLLYKLHHLQRAEELNVPQAVPGQQPGVVAVAQVPGQPPIVYPVKDPGQQPTMYPGQHVMISPGQQGFQQPGPPPAYDQK